MRALLIIAALASVAHADDNNNNNNDNNDNNNRADPTAEAAAEEANLESNAPRAGMTFSVALGGGVTMGDGVGRGPALSFRVGRVATPSTVLTLELTGGSLFHQEIAPMGMGPLRHNDFVGLLAGALHYVSGSFWIRGAGGLATYTVDSGDTTNHAHLGVGGVGGVGLDLMRWHYLVLGVESFAQLAIVGTRGLMVNTGLCLGLTYY